MTKSSKSRLPYLFIATIVIGVASGLGGMFLALLLHYVQRLAYAHHFTPIIGNETFLYVVTDSSELSRVMALLFCGLIAGLGWWALFRYGKPLVSISNALKSNRPYMPISSTIIHVLLQIITVALGSPLGREVAPREFAATFACWLTNKMNLRPKESQVLVACAAGAGLAAVYNIPFGGALFTLEVLLGSFKWFAVIPAITTSALAVVIAWSGLGNESFYHIPPLLLDSSVVIWSIVFGPLFGFAAYLFKEATNRAQIQAPRDWRIIVYCLLNFFLIGLLGIYFPELLGNGRSVVQLGYNGILALWFALVLFLLRVLIVCTSIQAGATGGLLTPSLANGTLMALVLGMLWSYFWPGTTLAGFAVIGGAAFLASAQKMPITAIVLVIEFTGINFSFFIPILFAVAGSISAFNLCTNRRLIEISLQKRSFYR